MTDEELRIRVHVLEERLERLAAAVLVLLEVIEAGSGKESAQEIRETLIEDFEIHGASQ